MKIFKIIRLTLAAVMIGLSCILPVPYKNEPPMFLIEQRDPNEEDLEEESKKELY